MNNFYKNSFNEYYLKLCDPLTIQNINAVRDDLQNSLDQVDELFLDHEDCSEFDLAYLQLLISAKKSALAKNKNIRLKCNNPEPLVSLADGSGFPSFLSWMSEENGGMNAE